MILVDKKTGMNMNLYAKAKVLGFGKVVRVISEILGGVFALIISIKAIINFGNLPFVINVPSQIIIGSIIVLVILIVLYIAIRVYFANYYEKWKFNSEKINEQLTKKISELTSNKQEPIPDINPRDPTYDFALARSFSFELTKQPILKLYLNSFSLEKGQLNKLNQGKLRLYLITPGMFKTYLVIKDDQGKEDLFLVDCGRTNSYERDYAITLYSLFIPILSSITSSLSQTYSDDYQIEINGIPDLRYFYYINIFHISKTKSGYLLEIPIL